MADAAASPCPGIRHQPLATQTAPPGDYRSVLDAIGGDVPDAHGRFDRGWKRAHGIPVKLSEDWFEDLLHLPPSRIAPSLMPVFRDCVLETALLRASGRIGRLSGARSPEGVETLLDVAYLHKGTFRDEVGRALVAMGDSAVPTLVRAAVVTDSRIQANDRTAAARSRYATHLLGRMDRLHPQRAMASVR